MLSRFLFPKRRVLFPIFAAVANLSFCAFGEESSADKAHRTYLDTLRDENR